MKKTYRINFPKVINLLFLALILQCCTPMSKITYLNEADLTGFDISPKPPKHVLEIGDILMVKVISRNEESNNLFNIPNPLLYSIRTCFIKWLVFFNIIHDFLIRNIAK